MLIELLNENENVITKIHSHDPETEFNEHFKGMYKAKAWREYVEPEPNQEELDAKHNAEIQAKINAIESKNARALRDAILRNDLTYIQEQDRLIAELRSLMKG